MLELRARLIGTLPTPADINAALGRGIALAGLAARNNLRDALGGRLIRRRTGKLQSTAVLRFTNRGGVYQARLGPLWFTGRFLDQGTKHTTDIVPFRYHWRYARRAAAATSPALAGPNVFFLDRQGRKILIRTRGARRALRFQWLGQTIFASRVVPKDLAPRRWFGIVEHETEQIVQRAFGGELAALVARANARAG